MNDNMKYWVWLQRAVGKGANLARLLAPYGGSVRALYEADPEERERLLRETPSEADHWQLDDLKSSGVRGGDGLSPRAAELEELRSGQLSFGGAGRRKNGSKAKKTRPVAASTLQRMKKVSLSEAEEVLELCEKTGVTMLCPEDDHYPALLREVPSFPAVLYAVGDVSLFQETTLPMAMVGARDARLSSLSAASMLAESLARAGFLIVSGGAIGTDSACHIGALNAGCPTVAVLGTGIGTKYLQQNADLRRVIARNGVLLSEMEPGEPGSKGSFPLRNRIIAGMSVGTVVVEAAVKSGSLITSKYAEEFDRDVFVPLFPGIDPERPLQNSAAFRGTRELVERLSAEGIRCAADVLEAYAGTYGLGPAEVAASGRVPAADLTRDITDPAGLFPPRLSQPMVLRARRQLGLDLAGGALNRSPGWGPYRTAEDAALRTYTSAEFAYRRGDHPHATPRTDGALALKEGPAGGGSLELAFEKDSPQARSAPVKPLKDLTTEARRVLSCFRPDPERPLYYEDFIADLDMAPQYMLAALTELQLAGYVDLLPDERYRCTSNLKGWTP